MATSQQSQRSLLAQALLCEAIWLSGLPQNMATSQSFPTYLGQRAAIQQAHEGSNESRHLLPSPPHEQFRCVSTRAHNVFPRLRTLRNPIDPINSQFCSEFRKALFLRGQRLAAEPGREGVGAGLPGGQGDKRGGDQGDDAVNEDPHVVVPGLDV